MMIADVTLVRENEDGSAVYQFDFPQEALDALTRLGIMTALKAGIEEAKKLHPDYDGGEENKWMGVKELNDDYT